VAALDLGTTSSRCIVFDQTGSPIGVAQRDHRQIRSARVGGTRPLEIKARVAEIAQGALAAARVAAVRARRGWDYETSGRRPSCGIARLAEPVCNAIVWQDTRTAGICRRARA